MLDIKYIRENSEEVKRGVADKQLDPKLVDVVLEGKDKTDEGYKVIQSKCSG